MLHHQHWALTGSTLGYPAAVLCHGRPVTLSLENLTIHLLQLIINNWWMMGWVNLKVWFWVWMVSGLVIPPAFFHSRHQGELHYFSNQLILHSEQQEAGPNSLLSCLQVLLSFSYPTRAIAIVFSSSGVGATLFSAAAGWEAGPGLSF